MFESLNLMNFSFFSFFSLAKAQLNLILPFLLALWMAWRDATTGRIPNYLTGGCALAGLGYQLGFHGLAGLADGFLGMGLGFALLIFFYVKGGMGAGDVKALAALGAWLGWLNTLYLFVYMAFSGVLLIVMVLWRRGLLRGKIRQLRGYLVNWALTGSQPEKPPPAAAAAAKSEQVPYAVAMAMGMAIICGQGLMS
jgi:prepilin peptidase CpaA